MFQLAHLQWQAGKKFATEGEDRGVSCGSCQCCRFDWELVCTCIFFCHYLRYKGCRGRLEEIKLNGRSTMPAKI